MLQLFLYYKFVEQEE